MEERRMTSSIQQNSNRNVSTLPPQSLPSIPRIDLSLSKNVDQAPVKRIHSDEDLNTWKSSKAQEHIVLFVSRLCESAVGKPTRLQSRDSIKQGFKTNGPIEKVLFLLDELQRWTEEIEPLKTPQRYGNLAFRTWGERMENGVSDLHKNLLPSSLQPFAIELDVYLSGGFGSWQRLDYGSGHELSFLAWLCYLYRLGFFDSSFSVEKQGDLEPPQIAEERLALEVFPKYLEVAWTIQDRYGLEPAGSHGVWGLDDYQFVPYAIGASQLRNQNQYSPIAVTSQSHKPESKPAKPSYLLNYMPKLTQTNPISRIEQVSAPPFANLYTSSIARIHSLKRGPFHEHSPILHDVASTVQNWVKVQSGMMKMWQAECLNKRPVVQHFPFGKIGFIWPDGNDSRGANIIPSSSSSVLPPPTAAPWTSLSSSSLASNSRQPMIPTGAPWAKNNNNPSFSATTSFRIPNPSSNVRSSSSTLASTGSAAATSSPFGVLERPSGFQQK